MRVIAKLVDRTQVPPDLIYSVSESQMFVTVGVEYDVHALSIFEGRASVLIVDDHGYPVWRKCWLFDQVETTIPADWICTLHDDEPRLLLGPEFIAKDIESYAAMVQHEADQVDKFWKYIGTLEEASRLCDVDE